MFNIYENIKNLAHKHGYSISGMCDAMGMSRATLSNLKNDRVQTLTVRNFQRIADFLGEPIDVVMHGERRTGEEKTALQDSKTDEEKRYDAMWASMPIEQKKAFFDFMRGIK